jgi:hypothetical protein
MADIPASTWSETDGSNNTASPEGAPEGMAPGGLNNTMRMMMGAVKRWFDWTIPKTTAGTTTAYTLSYSVAPTALVDGMSHLVLFNAACGASPTLNVNTLGAIPIYRYTGTAWAQITAAGTIPANYIARVSYNSSEGSYRIVGASFQIGAALLAAVSNFSAAINEAKGTDIASVAGITDIGAATGNFVDVTGTNTITGLGTVQAGTSRTVRFTGSLILTYHATALILPDAVNITTKAGDIATFRSLGSGNWVCAAYQPVARRFTNSLSGAVALNDMAQYFTGPTVAQGTVGTFFASGTVTMLDSGGAANYLVKLWDGTTVIASAVVSSPDDQYASASLSGYITNPAGNIRISVKDTSSVNGAILDDTTGEAKDSTLTAIRIA